MPRLRLTGGPAAGSVIEVGEELTVGRSEQGDGQLGGDPELSRRHARILVQSDGGLAVEDLGSTNGTYVDGRRISGTEPLPAGATLKMGQTTMVVEGVEDAGATEAAGVPVPPPADATQIDSPAPAPPVQPPPAQDPPPAFPPASPPPPPAQGPPTPVPGAAPPPPVPGGHTPPAPGAYPPAPQPPAKSGTSRSVIAAIVGVLLLLAVGAGALLLLSGGDDDKKDKDLPVEGPTSLKDAARAAGCTSVTETSEGDDHVETPPAYRSNPPHSGDHTPAVANDGRYREAPGIGQLVHALEHGRVLMWFNEGDTETSDELVKIGNEDARHMILTPNPRKMDYEVAVTAWTHLLGCPEMNDKVPDAIREFRDAYRDKGPELVP